MPKDKKIAIQKESTNKEKYVLRCIYCKVKFDYLDTYISLLKKLALELDNGYPLNSSMLLKNIQNFCLKSGAIWYGTERREILREYFTFLHTHFVSIISFVEYMSI